MRIDLPNDYYVESDSYCFTLAQNKYPKDPDKASYSRIVGYYPSLKVLLTAMIDRVAMSDKTIKSLDDLTKAIDTYTDTVNRLFDTLVVVDQDQSIVVSVQ